MIVDVHTHVFPSEVRERRDEYLQRDPTFRALYSRPDAVIATAEELLASMEAAGVDRSVVCGFAWRDAELCRQHNDGLLEAAARSSGRLVPFCTVQPAADGAEREIERCAGAGARGLGELRPLDQGYGLVDSQEARLLASAAERLGLALLFHVSEPVGHAYAGKAGLPLEQAGGFVAAHPGVTVIAAHWGGGLPFYALMPAVAATLTNTYVDSAASALLYSPEIYGHAVDLLGAERVLFGSDYPLLSQERALAELRAVGIDASARRLIEGENARRLLGLGDG